MKKMKQPGDNISLKTKKTEDPAVMDWINSQTNLMDSLRYLIEVEIAQHGVRNLQMFIPAERNILGAGLALSTSVMMQQLERKTGTTELPRETSNVAIVSEPVVETPPAEMKTSKPVAEEEIDEEDIEAWV